MLLEVIRTYPEFTGAVSRNKYIRSERNMHVNLMRRGDLPFARDFERVFGGSGVPFMPNIPYIKGSSTVIEGGANVRAGLSGFDLIQHFDGGLDGCFGLVSIEAAGLELRVVVAPGDDGLDEGVGTTAGGDGDSVVRQHREGAAE